MFLPPIKEVHISVTFTWDRTEGARLLLAWRKTLPNTPVHIGGPAFGAKCENFVPGLYLKQGVTITSRGCPNHCPFCFVPKREGRIRELPIRDGWIVQDDNLLACSDGHFRAVMAMLRRQKERPRLMGLEAARLTRWKAEEIYSTNPEEIFFAYDTPGDLEPLRRAVETCRAVGFKTEGAKHRLRSYVLIGYRDDTFKKAEERLNTVLNLGVLPMAMLYRGEDGAYDQSWRRFQREWARPFLTGRKMKEQECDTQMTLI